MRLSRVFCLSVCALSLSNANAQPQNQIVVPLNSSPFGNTCQPSSPIYSFQGALYACGPNNTYVSNAVVVQNVYYAASYGSTLTDCGARINLAVAAIGTATAGRNGYGEIWVDHNCDNGTLWTTSAVSGANVIIKFIQGGWYFTNVSHNMNAMECSGNGNLQVLTAAYQGTYFAEFSGANLSYLNKITATGGFVKGCIFYGNYTGNPTGGDDLQIIGADANTGNNILIENSSFIYAKGDGIHVKGCVAANCAFSNTFSNVEVLYNQKWGFEFEDALDQSVNNNSVSSANVLGGLTCTRACAGLYVNGSFLAGNTGPNIQITAQVSTESLNNASNFLIFSGNKFGSSGARDIQLGCWDAGHSAYSIQNVIISGNNFPGSTLLTSNTFPQIELDDCTGIGIIANAFNSLSGHTNSYAIQEVSASGKSGTNQFPISANSFIGTWGTAWTLDLAPSSLLRNYYTTFAATNTAAILVGNMAGVRIIGTPTSNAVYTSDTAANICTNFGTGFSPAMNQAVPFQVRNISSLFTITLAGGSGVTLDTAGSFVIPAGAERWFTLNPVNCGSGTQSAKIYSEDVSNPTTGFCQSSASPAVCSGYSSGGVVVAAAATTVTVNTTAVTANSQILILDDSSLGTALSVTCNTTTPTALSVTARVAATSFTITSTAPVTNPLCLSYLIIN